MQKIANLANILNEFFNKKADDISLTTGFVKRKRKLRGSAFIKAMVLGNLGNGSCSIDGLCQFLYEDSIEITKQGLDFRFTKSAEAFMEKMFHEALNLFKNSLLIEAEILRQFKSVKLLDSTYINLPSSMENFYKGYGSSYQDRKSPTKSGLKLQFVFDYLNQTLDRLDLKEGKRSDQGYKDHLNDVAENDLLIADLGYFVPESFKRIEESKGYFISRYKADTNLYDVNTHQKLDLLKELGHQEFLEKQVLLGKEVKQQVRIICKKLSSQQSIARKRKANKLAKSHGYTSSQRNQRLLDWSIFITNIPENKVCSENVFLIYRLRWQIELLFKLYKSYIQIETLKGKLKSSRILCELYAKLCIGIIFQAMTGCIELGKDADFSPTKAMIELKNRARELFLALNSTVDHLQIFLKKLIWAWSRLSLKDRYRKTRISTLSAVKLLTVSP